MKLKSFFPLGLFFLASFCTSVPERSIQSRARVLILDGENNHPWEVTTVMLEKILESQFEVEIATRLPGIEFNPRFQDFNVVLSNYNGDPWTQDVNRAFENYVRGGGGFVSVHAANNAFPEWGAYNAIIGLGGWGNRDQSHGPYVRIRDGDFVRDFSNGKGGSHGQQHEFLITARTPDHPILQGLPKEWMHAKDELYDRLRGPAQNLEVLATAFSDTETGGSGEHEPVLMTVRYGEGRVFHTTLGHSPQSMRGLGFQETLLRGTEWAATGKVDLQKGIELQDLSSDRASYRYIEDPESIDSIWVSLFDSRSLKGWTQLGGAAIYSVEDGLIVGTTNEGSPNSFLCTKDQYSDFELMFDVMVDVELNSGVQIRSKSLPEYKDGRVHGPQIEIPGGCCKGNAGYVYSEATGRGYLSRERPVKNVFKDGEWNRYRVRAHGPHIQTWLNGVAIEDLKDEESSQSGFIGLQVHKIPSGDGPYKVRWRNILIRELH